MRAGDLAVLGGVQVAEGDEGDALCGYGSEDGQEGLESEGADGGGGDREEGVAEVEEVV